MKKKIYRFLFFTALVVLGLNAFYNYATYKMHQELPIYNKFSIQAQNLSETYMLCSGLLLSNPTEENIKSCNAIKSKMHALFEQMDDECPYISFYTKYIHFNL